MTQTLYAGMAGDTDEGRFVSAGLYRKIDDGAMDAHRPRSSTEPPEVHAILTDPRRPDRVLIGSRAGSSASDDRGETLASATGAEARACGLVACIAIRASPT